MIQNGQRFGSLLQNVQDYATDHYFKEEAQQVVRKRLDSAIAENDRLKLIIQAKQVEYHKGLESDVQELKSMLAKAKSALYSEQRQVEYWNAQYAQSLDRLNRALTSLERARQTIRGRKGSPAKGHNKGKPKRVRSR